MMGGVQGVERVRSRAALGRPGRKAWEMLSLADTGK